MKRVYVTLEGKIKYSGKSVVGSPVGKPLLRPEFELHQWLKEDVRNGTLPRRANAYCVGDDRIEKWNGCHHEGHTKTVRYFKVVQLYKIKQNKSSP